MTSLQCKYSDSQVLLKKFAYTSCTKMDLITVISGHVIVASNPDHFLLVQCYLTIWRFRTKELFLDVFQSWFPSATPSGWLSFYPLWTSTATGESSVSAWRTARPRPTPSPTPSSASSTRKSWLLSSTGCSAVTSTPRLAITAPWTLRTTTVSRGSANGRHADTADKHAASQN